jgi:hypothetical protein
MGVLLGNGGQKSQRAFDRLDSRVDRLEITIREGGK